MDGVRTPAPPLNHTHTHTHTQREALLAWCNPCAVRTVACPTCHNCIDRECCHLNKRFVFNFFVSHVLYCSFHLLPHFVSFIPIFITSVFLFSLVSYSFLYLLLVYFYLPFTLFRPYTFIPSFFFTTDLTFKTSTICPQSVLMLFIYLSQKNRLHLTYSRASMRLFFHRTCLLFRLKNSVRTSLLNLYKYPCCLLNIYRY